MTRKARASALAAALAFCAYGAGVAARSGPHPGHTGHNLETPHHGGQTPAHYLTLNVSVSDEGIEPNAVFVPAGQPVQLMLRNRTTAEHHYHVVGLEPDELWWVARGENATSEAASDSSHDHHNRQIVRSRPTSPAGITPTGREVHGYVSAANIVDVVLFTATQTGTFEVVDDLHPDKTARLTVFDPAPSTEAAAVPTAGPAIARALSRDLGSIDYPAVSDVRVEALYAPAEYVTHMLGPQAGMSPMDVDKYVAMLLTERSHAASLPRHTVAPALYVTGTPVPLIDSRVVTDSPHHRATAYRFASTADFGAGHQMLTLRLASGQEATWHLPLVLPEATAGGLAAGILGEQWGLILALLGGMLAAMWPCLFQLTVYFIPALAGVAMQDAGGSKAARRRKVLQAAFFFILGFTILYTATGALIGFAAQQLGDTRQFEAWQRYFGIGAGMIVIALALRVAAKVRAPLVCRMPVLSSIAHSKKPASRLEMMLAGVAFATGCMTCFGSALVVGMVVYIGMAQSAFYGALVLFLFSLGMGLPLVIAAVAMARTLPLLMRLETAVPWMGLVSAVIMAGFGTLLISGHYMVVAEWTQRLVGG